MYLNSHGIRVIDFKVEKDFLNVLETTDPLVDRNCAVLDGKCDCPNTGGAVPDACKYLRTNV